MVPSLVKLLTQPLTRPIQILGRRIKERKSPYPDGGNEVFVDGSASWNKIETMHQFTSWTAANEMWFYQRTDDITGFGTMVEINSLRWMGN